MHYLKSFKSVSLHIYSLLLFIATFLWMALPYNTGPDKTIQKWVGAVRMLLPDKHKPAPDEIIFIDVSTSKYLVPLNEDSTENDIITNRKYLSELFTLLTAHDNQVKYLFCDVHFDISTPDDSALFQSISGLKDKFLSIDTYSDNCLNRNPAGVRSATASLLLQQGAVYKIPYFGSFSDTLVPFKIYTDLDKGNVRQNFLFTWFSGKGIAFNNQINDYPLRSSDFNNGNYMKIGLGELVSVLKLSPEVFSWCLQDRFLLIGDFANDVHNTYLNKQPGTLILFEIPVNILSISLLLMIFSYISSLLFSVNISIFHLITIFSLVDFIKFVWKKRIKKISQKKIIHTYNNPDFQPQL